MNRLSECTYKINSIHNSRKRVVVHFDRLKKCAGDMRLQSKICSSELSSADSDTPNHHPAEGMEIVKDMDDPGAGEHVNEVQPVDMPAGGKQDNYSIMKYRCIMKNRPPPPPLKFKGLIFLKERVV